MSVGVAIALYNGARFLEEQLDSIRCQTCPPDRVVMCDDGSKDDTVTIARQYIEKHQLQDRWSVSVNQQNLGYAKNFYHAMSLCGTDLIYMCDQDDIWKADKIERMNRVMACRPDISLLMCKGGVMDAEGKPAHGLLIPESKETGVVEQIRPSQVLRSLSWVGMLMCVRKAFTPYRHPMILRLPCVLLILAHSIPMITLALTIDAMIITQPTKNTGSPGFSI